jgi:DNA-binding FadR family transcriptional regulator
MGPGSQTSRHPYSLMGEPASSIAIVIDFHLSLAQASQNVILAGIVDGIQHLTRSSMQAL